MTTSGAVDADGTKANGIHYTPSPLAGFVASQTLALVREPSATCMRVLDPACGDGELLIAAGRAMRSRGLSFELVGFDADPAATGLALTRIRDEFGPDVPVRIATDDFLARVLTAKASESQLGTHEGADRDLLARFDLVIANPPYVRTQVLGARRAQELASAFGLAGRVDLYQAFVLAIRDVVREGCPVGLIVSNRFLTVKGGSSLRLMLARDFAIDRIIDLGDTKLFRAAVLPALIFAYRSSAGTDNLSLTSVYEDRSVGLPTAEATNLFDLLSISWTGTAAVDGRVLCLRNGTVPKVDLEVRPWVADAEEDDWLNRLDKATFMRLGDIGKIRVGIKTTADSVFIRSTWDDVEPRPEPELLLPLVTHHCARRWRASSPERKVLYPYDRSHTRRVPLDIERWPAASAYLQAHKDRLAGRRYVIESGRNWWEIWVPQRPGEWSKPRLVFPDISERPCFFLDESGAVVNGDCYWMTIPDEERDTAMLALAVANSSLAERYYDARCGNKLYAGRRRYITQYVEDFPIPDPSSEVARKIVHLVTGLVDGEVDPAVAEEELDSLVWEAFGIEDMRR